MAVSEIGKHRIEKYFQVCVCVCVCVCGVCVCVVCVCVCVVCVFLFYYYYYFYLLFTVGHAPVFLWLWCERGIWIEGQQCRFWFSKAVSYLYRSHSLTNDRSGQCHWPKRFQVELFT